MRETYNFNIIVGFRVEADNEHDALRAALNAESSLNEASLRESRGATSRVVRVKAPLLRAFKRTHKDTMPESPVERSSRDTIGRMRNILAPLSHKWAVALRWHGKDYSYNVDAPTEEQAIEKARVDCYHETSHMGTSLVSVRQEG